MTAEDERFAAERAAWTEKVHGMGRCPSCGGELGWKVFGGQKLGVMVGCAGMEKRECARHVLVKVRGWSFDEVCEEWQRRNTGVWKWVGKLKGVWRRRFGVVARNERRMEREKRAREKAAREERERVFGVMAMKAMMKENEKRKEGR